MSTEVIHKIDKLYGTLHGGEKTLLGIIRFGEIATRPSWELIEDLELIPEGTVVGIEECDPKEIRRETYNVNTTRFSFSKESKVYWREIKQICKRRGLPIAYLDSFKLYKEIVAKNLERREEHKDVLRDMYPGDALWQGDEIPDSKVIALNEEIYKRQIEAQYIFEVRREEAMVANILKYKPSRVIIGRGHSDYLLSGQDDLTVKGLVVGEYRREYNPYGEAFLVDEPITLRLAPPDSEIDPAILLDRKLLMRNYRLVTERKLLADGNPDYVGTWDLKSPSRGYFEVYIEEQNRKNEFWGLIEDGLGTAAFQGKLKNKGKTVEFDKTYIEDMTSSKAIKPGILILYSGILEDGIYKGSFYAENPRYARPFILSKDQSLILK